jgi:hypothetical protein
VIANRTLAIGGGALAVALFLLFNGLFIVDERKRALVLQFGQVVGQPISEPGLNLKIPFIQNVVFFEDRILPLETTSLEITPLDDRRLVVDAFARWRIVDTVQFRRAVTDEVAALPRLERILTASLREVLGSVGSDSILSDARNDLMNRIRDASRRSASELGVEIVDRTCRPPTSACRPNASAKRPTSAPAARRPRSACAPTPTARRWSWCPRRGARPRSSAARPTPSATASSPKPLAAIPNSSPSSAR